MNVADRSQAILSLPPALLAHGPFAFVDVETTGMQPRDDRLTEIAILRYDTAGRIEQWSSLVNPGVPIPPDIQAMTGITPAMVRNAPAFDAVVAIVGRLLEGAVFVAHNARFDYGFIKHAFRRAGRRFTADVLCTVRLSRLLYPDHAGHGLDQLITRHRLDGTGRHRALGDAALTAGFVAAACGERGADIVAAAVRRLLRTPSLPAQLPPGALDDLPDGPGVYVFHGVNDLPLYIGKAKHLRERVRAHFSSDHMTANDIRLSRELTRIEWFPTAGEVGALVLESRWVKSRAPLHNIALRRHARAGLMTLSPEGTEPAFEPLGHDRLDWDVLTARDTPVRAWGPFADRTAARRWLETLAQAHRLCPRALGLEPHHRAQRTRGGDGSNEARSPCFSRQIGRCMGWCVGEESTEAHRDRFIAAAEPTRLRTWPWIGPVAFEEFDEANDRRDRLLFDRWCLVEDGVRQPFDRDIYRLLVRLSERTPEAFVESAAVRSTLASGEPD